MLPYPRNIDEDFQYDCDPNDNVFILLWDVILNESHLRNEFFLGLEDAKEEIYDRLELRFKKDVQWTIGSDEYVLSFDTITIPRSISGQGGDYNFPGEISFVIIHYSPFNFPTISSDELAF